MRTCLVLLSLLILSGPVAAFAAAAAPDMPPPSAPMVDFNRDIQPLLAQHCLRCHGPMKQDGDLRLDSRVAAEKGGDSGRSVLMLPPEKNEILRRLRSMEPGDRMPLEGPPLDEASLQKFEAWIRAGAVWPEKMVAKFTPYQEAWWETAAGWLLSKWEEWHGKTIVPALYFLIPLAIVVLFLERARETRRAQLRKGEPVSPWAERWAHVSRAWQLAGFLAVTVGALVLWTRSRLAEIPRLQGEVTKLQKQLSKMDADPERTVRPVHAPRMGGKYYRGNDERSPALFNGGYYRTATFEIHLLDPAGQPLIWGDPIPARATVQVLIAKAPFAAPSLFTGEMMGAVGMSAKHINAQGTGEEVPPYSFLKPSDQEGIWVAELPVTLDPQAPRQEGKVYLNAGMQETGGRLQGVCHYSVGYKLVAADGKLTTESEVWMESILKPGQLIWTPEGRISAQEWFDALPIPEIVNGNSSDPKLLGTEVHIEMLRRLREDRERERALAPEPATPPPPPPAVLQPMTPNSSPP